MSSIVKTRTLDIMIEPQKSTWLKIIIKYLEVSQGIIVIKKCINNDMIFINGQ